MSLSAGLIGLVAVATSFFLFVGHMVLPTNSPWLRRTLLVQGKSPAGATNGRHIIFSLIGIATSSSPLSIAVTMHATFVLSHRKTSTKRGGGVATFGMTKRHSLS
ncbi:hypothetical protein PIB30_077015, partial [Stylosanthes scabra]|nr:hypothetical protein [Stylosanthes scabra]